MKILFLELAEQELYDSQEYYEEQQTNLSNKFKSEVYNSLKRIQKFPNMFVKVKKNIRKCIINKFLFNNKIVLTHLVKRKPSLEQQFLTLTKNN